MATALLNARRPNEAAKVWLDYSEAVKEPDKKCRSLLRAAQMWSVAGREHHLEAAVVLKSIKQRFPDTRWAKEADQQLASLGKNFAEDAVDVKDMPELLPIIEMQRGPQIDDIINVDDPAEILNM